MEKYKTTTLTTRMALFVRVTASDGILFYVYIIGKQRAMETRLGS